MSKDLKWPYWPNEGSQTEMWDMLGPKNTSKLYIGYGGPRGGGKSYGARSWAATACMTMPLNVVIVRRTLEDLKKNHIEPMKIELKDFLESKVISYNSQDKRFIFKPTGASMWLMYCDKEIDLNQFQGQSIDVIIIEEAGQFFEPWIAYIISANRKSGPMIDNNIDFVPKTLMTFNWGGPGHKYLRRVFWDGQYVPHVNKPGRLEVYRDGEEYSQFHFIFAPYDQNTPLAEQDPNYLKKLRLLSPELQKAYIDGDPDAFSGTMFDLMDSVHKIKPFMIPDHWYIMGSLDPGTGSHCSFGLYAKSPNGYMFKVFHYYIKGRNPRDHAAAISELVYNCEWTGGRPPEIIFAGRDAFAKQERYGFIANDVTWQSIFAGSGLYLTPAVTARIPGAMAMQQALSYKADDEGDITQPPALRFFTGYNDATIDELRALLRSKTNPEDIEQGPNIDDHAYDETRYFIMGALTPLDHVESDGTVEVRDGYKQQLLEENVVDWSELD